MIAYDKTWLANKRIQDKLSTDLSNGYITNAELNGIVEKYPVGFYSPNQFVRFGLFILTCIIILFADGLLSLMAAGSGSIEKPGWIFFLGILTYVTLELMVNLKHHYRSGVDDALTIIAALQFVIGFVMLFRGNEDNYRLIAAIVFMISLYFSIRFADMLQPALCFTASITWIFFSWTKLVPYGITTVPFALMFISGLVYLLSFKYSKRTIFKDYETCIIVLQLISLLALYASGNYYVIQTMGATMPGANGPVPFGALFWLWTIILPFIYIAFGMYKKNAVTLRIGLFLVAAAAVTFRNYYHLLPVDVTLTILGAVILAIVYAVIRYLKTPKHGFTYSEADKQDAPDRLSVESLIIAETFSHTPAAPANNGTKFGGGDFGGGGSSGNF